MSDRRDDHCRFPDCGGFRGHNWDVLPLFRRHDLEPFRSLCFSDKLAVMGEHHLRAVASFEADLVDVFDNGESVGNERVAQGIVLPSHFCRWAEVLKTLLVRALKRANWAGLANEWCKPSSAVVRDRHGAAAGGLGFGGFDFDEVFRAGEMNFAPIEAGYLSGAQSAKRGNRQIGYHRLAVPPFTTLLYRRYTSSKELAEFVRREDFNFAAGISDFLHAAKFVMIFGQITAPNAKFEQCADKAAVVVLSASGNATIREPVLNLFAADGGDRHRKSICELAEAKAEFFGVRFADSRVRFHSEQFVQDFADGPARPTGRVTGKIKVDAFLEGRGFRQTFDGNNVVRDGRVEVSVMSPFAELLHGVDVGGTVKASEFEDLTFSVGEFGENELASRSASSRFPNFWRTNLGNVLCWPVFLSTTWRVPW